MTFLDFLIAETHDRAWVAFWRDWCKCPNRALFKVRLHTVLHQVVVKLFCVLINFTCEINWIFELFQVISFSFIIKRSNKADSVKFSFQFFYFICFEIWFIRCIPSYRNTICKTFQRMLCYVLLSSACNFILINWTEFKRFIIKVYQIKPEKWLLMLWDTLF